jgi:hypothetical protein
VVDVPTTTSGSGSAGAVTPTAYPYACPANDGSTVTDQAGDKYVLACGRNTNHGIFGKFLDRYTIDLGGHLLMISQHIERSLHSTTVSASVTSIHQTSQPAKAVQAGCFMVALTESAEVNVSCEW